MKEEITRPTVMEVSIKNFKHNINEIKKVVGKDTNIMPVIKANGYGTYINKRLDVLNEFDIVGLATVDEGVNVRRLGYKKDIFILNQPYIGELSKIIDNDLVIGLSSTDFLEEVLKQDKCIRVHIEIDTGMGRTGVLPSNINAFINRLKSANNIKVEGIYTHLSSADTDQEYTKKQLETFKGAVRIIRSEMGDIKYVHASASNGIINFQSGIFNLARPGIIMYGYESFKGTYDKIPLKPVAKLKSKITFLKEVNEGTSISYSRRFITKRKSVIATIPIGYADGLRRMLSNRGYVVINERKAPIIGSVCMDGIMVDVTDIKEVNVGDDVFIWDNDIIKLDEIADLCGTINYEIMSTITYRVPRVFVENENEKI